MKNTLKRYIELADKITTNPDEGQKYTGLCKLMGEIKNTIPNPITANAKTIDGNKELRLYVCRHYICHNGYGDQTYRGQMDFIKDHNSDIQVWEQETGDTLKERQNKLEQYKDIDFLPETLISTQTYRPENCINSVTKTQKEPHPDQIYCRSGKNYYRQWHDLKNAPFFRLFWQIWQQGNTADFETICEMVCLYIALKNEVELLADELRLIGQLPRQANEPTTNNDSAKELPIDFDISDSGLSMYLDKVFGVIPPDEYMKTTPDGRYYMGYNIKENSPFESKSQCLYLLCKIRQLTRELKKTPDYKQREKIKNDREKLYAEYRHIITPQQPTSTQPTEAMPTANRLLVIPEFKLTLKHAIKDGFILENTNGGYGWNGDKCPLQYAYYFADCARKHKMIRAKIKDVATLLGITNLPSYKKYLTPKGEKIPTDEQNLKRQINSLFP